MSCSSLGIALRASGTGHGKAHSLSCLQQFIPVPTTAAARGLPGEQRADLNPPTTIPSHPGGTRRARIV